MRPQALFAVLCAVLCATVQSDAPLLGAAAHSAAAQTAAAGDDEVLRSDLGCGYVNNSKW